MTMSADRGSAKIYQFPARGRFAGGNRGAESILSEKPRLSEKHSVLTPSAQRLAKAVFGSAWYHDAAIEDDKRSGKN
jgi:uncharacterized protein DUF2735